VNLMATLYVYCIREDLAHHCLQVSAVFTVAARTVEQVCKCVQNNWEQWVQQIWFLVNDCSYQMFITADKKVCMTFTVTLNKLIVGLIENITSFNGLTGIHYCI